MAHKIHLPKYVHKLVKSRPALTFLVMPAWLYVTRLTRPKKTSFLPFLCPPTTSYHAYNHAHYISIYLYRHSKPIIKEIIERRTLVLVVLVVINKKMSTDKSAKSCDLVTLLIFRATLKLVIRTAHHATDRSPIASAPGGMSLFC